MNWRNKSYDPGKYKSDFDPLPVGTYNAVLIGFQESYSDSLNNTQFEWVFQICNKGFTGKQVRINTFTSISPGSYAGKLLIAMGVNLDKPFTVGEKGDNDILYRKLNIGLITTKSKKGKEYNKIDSWMPFSALQSYEEPSNLMEPKFWDDIMKEAKSKASGSGTPEDSGQTEDMPSSDDDIPF